MADNKKMVEAITSMDVPILPSGIPMWLKKQNCAIMQA